MASSLSIHHPLFPIIISQLHSVTGSAVCCTDTSFGLGVCESLCEFKCALVSSCIFGGSVLFFAFLTPTGLFSEYPEYNVGITALFFFSYILMAEEIRSVGSCPAFFFVFCLALALLLLFLHHLTRGSFNLQGPGEFGLPSSRHLED